MGLFIDEVLFEGEVPEISRIAAKVAELSGLAVRIQQTVDRDASDPDDLYGSLAFECAPDDEIALSAGRAGEGMFAFTQIPPAEADATADGQEGPPGKRAVRLMGGGHEPTLSTYIHLALEALGGELAHPVGEEFRRMCAAPITELELERRRWKASANHLLMLVMAVVTAPLQPIFCFHWPKFSRADLNNLMRKEHERHGEPGEPEQFGRIRYAWARIALIAIFPLVLIGSIFTAIVTAIGALLMFLYSSVTFIGKTARLVLHLYTRRESAPLPAAEEDAYLTAAEKSARNILNGMKQTYGAPEKMILADEAEFSHLDLRGYRRFRAELEAQGYKYIGDFEIRVVSRTNIAMFARTMIRVLASEDGSITTNYYQFRQRRWPLVKKLATGLLKLSWWDAPKYFAKDVKTRHCVGFGTEFDDGRFLVASNAEAAGKITMPPIIENHFFPYGTPPAVLLEAHRQRMQEILRASPGVKPVVTSSVEDVLRGHHRLSAQKAAYRASVRWITQDELRAMSGGNHDYADEVYDEVQKLLEQDAAR